MNLIAINENSGVLVMIGTNVNKEDAHIWDTISQTEADIAFIGDDNSFSNSQSLNSELDVIQIGTAFENSVGELIEYLQ